MINQLASFKEDPALLAFILALYLAAMLSGAGQDVAAKLRRDRRQAGDRGSEVTRDRRPSAGTWQQSAFRLWIEDQNDALSDEGEARFKSGLQGGPDVRCGLV